MLRLDGPHVRIGRDPRRLYVTQHQALQADGREYPCPHCPKVFESRAGLGGHIAWHRKRGDLPERAA